MLLARSWEGSELVEGGFVFACYVLSGTERHLLELRRQWAVDF
jgi:hypothetical protein